MSLLYQIIKRCKYSLPKMSLSSSFTNPRFKTIMVHIAKKRCMSMFIRKTNDIKHIWHLLILLKNLREEIYIRYWPQNLKTTNTTYLVFDYWYLRVVFASFFKILELRPRHYCTVLTRNPRTFKIFSSAILLF